MAAPDGFEKVSDLIVNGERKNVILSSGRSIVIFKHHNKLFALDQACYHHGGPLGMGDIEEFNGRSCVVCPWHQYKIALDTGECLYIGLEPALGAAGAPQVSSVGGGAELRDMARVVKSKGVKQRIHPVQIRSDGIYVADAALVSISEVSASSAWTATLPIGVDADRVAPQAAESLCSEALAPAWCAQVLDTGNGDVQFSAEVPLHSSVVLSTESSGNPCSSIRHSVYGGNYRQPRLPQPGGPKRWRNPSASVSTTSGAALSALTYKRETGGESKLSEIESDQYAYSEKHRPNHAFSR